MGQNMPSLNEAFNGSGTQTVDHPALPDGRLQAVAGDAAQLSERLSAIGICCFLLGVGIAFFFDSLLGTIAYVLTLGQLAYGLLRVFLATVPTRDLPWILAWATGAPLAGRPTTLRNRIRSRLPRLRSAGHSMGHAPGPGVRERLHDAIAGVGFMDFFEDSDRL